MCFDFSFRLTCIDKLAIHVSYFSAASRVLKIMCGVINFIKFQQGRIQIYQDLKDENVNCMTKTKEPVKVF